MKLLHNTKVKITTIIIAVIVTVRASYSADNTYWKYINGPKSATLMAVYQTLIEKGFEIETEDFSNGIITTYYKSVEHKIEDAVLENIWDEFLGTNVIKTSDHGLKIVVTVSGHGDSGSKITLLGKYRYYRPGAGQWVHRTINYESDFWDLLKNIANEVDFKVRNKEY